MLSFDELISGKGIFSDRAVLSPHYMPETMVYREDELRRIMVGVAPVLTGQKAKNLFLYGNTGTGKTSSIKQVIGKLAERNDPRVYVVYMNCRVYDSRYKAIQKVITTFKPHFAKSGYSFTVLYEELLNWVESGGKEKVPDGKHLIIVLDEVDYVSDLDELIYTLTRINDDLGKGSVSVVGVSNRVNFKSRLDPRSRSSLCEEEVVFAPYNAGQLQGILANRVGRAFVPGVIDDSAVNLASAIAAGENGDARYALLLLLRAGELCETRGSKKISDSEVEEARKLADEEKAFEVISSLPEHQRLLLYALAMLYEDVTYKRLVEDGSDKLYFSGVVYERYESICKKTGKEPRTSRWYREYLSELEMLGLIAMVSSGKGVRGHTTLIKLAYPSDKVKGAIEKTMLE